MNLLELAIGRGTALVMVMTVALGSLLYLSPAPERGRVVVTETETTILDVIEFAPGTATLRASSRPTLDAVAETMRGNPSIELVEVQSHTRDNNQAVSDRRAAVVVAYLVAAGVEPERLVARGYGDSQPLDRAAPTKNERIAFLILKRAGDTP